MADRIVLSPQALSPEAFSALLENADETDLRLLLWVRSYPAPDGVYSVSGLSEALGLTDADVLASVKFWQGAGVLGKTALTRKKAITPPVAEQPSEPSPVKKLARRDTLPDYTSEEIASILSSGRVSADFADRAQKAVGKLFTANEMSTVLAMVNDLRLPESVVLTLLQYYNGSDDRPLRYTEKVALSLTEKGITTLAAVNEYLTAEDRRKQTEGVLRVMFGLGNRALTEREKTYFSAWTEEMNYDVEVIRLAYEITVDKKGTYNASYLNGVLKGWHKDGLATKEDVENYLRDRKANAVLGTVSSISTSDIIDKALDTSWMDAFSKDKEGEEKQ